MGKCLYCDNTARVIVELGSECYYLCPDCYALYKQSIFESEERKPEDHEA